MFVGNGAGQESFSEDDSADSFDPEDEDAEDASAEPQQNVRRSVVKSSI